MGAPDNAISLEAFSDPEQWKTSPARHLSFTCAGCGYQGTAGELLTEPEGDNQTLWCPVCGGAGWVWD
jgi:hypothetical protein